jgi:hypothetical protein
MTVARQDEPVSPWTALGAILVWIAASSGVLASLELLTVESAFVFGFIGLLILTELFAPKRSSTWWMQTYWIKVVGFVVLGYFVWLQAMQYIG